MKKIIIFTSHGGGGHVSVSNALADYLKDEYRVRPVEIFSDVLGFSAPGRHRISHKITGENLYNFFIRRKWYRAIHVMSIFSKWYFRFAKKSNRWLIERFLSKEKPDAIISVVPYVNGNILAVAKKLSIPFILIPTDLDSRTFLYGMKENADYQKLYVAQAFDDPRIEKMFIDEQIPEKAIHVTGFPLRKDFFEQKNIHHIKDRYNVPEGKPVVLVLMGAQGSVELVKMCKEFKKVRQPFHLLICRGRAENLQHKLEQISYPPHITSTIIGHTNRISDLFCIADIFVTKSGTVSFCEGVYSKVPMLIDGTSRVLRWEQFNHSFAGRYGFGRVIRSRNELSSFVEELLTHPDLRIVMKESSEKLEPKAAQDHIAKLIKRATF